MNIAATANHENEIGMGDSVESMAGGERGTAAEKSAWPSFLAAHEALLAKIEARLAAAGLPELAWYDVLWSLERAPDNRLRMAELANAAIIARSNLTRLVDRLEKSGLVMRERVEGDRRGAYAVLTPDGHEMRKRMWAVYGPAIEECFGQHLTAEENAYLRQIFLRLIAAARASTS